MGKRKGELEFPGFGTPARPHVPLPLLGCATCSASNEILAELRAVLAVRSAERIGRGVREARAFAQGAW
ncbi:MAG: hypothetical protein E8D52_03835 [Nitrospira sp.]|nr:MAG: hypothetical protein E8D52_03835 [Nitrospira sp.]